MNPFNLIGFTGLAGAGKSTAAGTVEARMRFTRLSFADPLRKMLGCIGIEREQMKSGKMEIVPWLGKSPRQMLQTLGTEWGRQMVHPDLWILVAKREIEIRRASNLYAGTVIDDVRFDNEARLIRELGGVVIKIERPGLEAGRMTHASEAGVSPDLIDLTISSPEGAPEVLKGIVAEFLAEPEKFLCT